jgi:hypothetical protein
MTHPWYTRELLNLGNRKARAFKYTSRTGNCKLYERLRAEHKHLYNERFASYMDGIENGIKLLSMIRSEEEGGRLPFLNSIWQLVWGDCPADICELFADLFESVR